MMDYAFAVGFIFLLLAYMILLSKYRHLRDYDQWEEFIKNARKKEQ